MYACMCLCAYVYMSAGAQRGIEFPWTGIIGDFDCLVWLKRTECESFPGAVYTLKC